MKTKTKPEFASSPQEWGNAKNDESIVRRERQTNEPLTEDELRQLKALAAMPDSEIDFSDIPEWTAEDFRGAIRGALAPKSAREVTLYLDDYVASWLRENLKRQAHAISFELKRVVQHGKRSAHERSKSSGRPIYDPASEPFKEGLELIAGRRSPRLKYVEVPEFADDDLMTFSPGEWPALNPYVFTLLLDDEVYMWLQTFGSTHTFRVNYALSSLAHQFLAGSKPSFSKAS